MGVGRIDVERAVRHLEAQGAAVRKTRKGYQVRFADGSTLTLHLSLSDNRALRNARATALRAGLTWPGDRHRTKD